MFTTTQHTYERENLVKHEEIHLNETYSTTTKERYVGQRRKRIKVSRAEKNIKKSSNQQNGSIHYSDECKHPTFEYRGRHLVVDFVLAAKVHPCDDKIMKLRKLCFSTLRKKRLKVSAPMFSQNEQIVFWLLYAPFEVLCDAAEDLSLRLPTVQNDITVSIWYDKFLNKLFDWWNSVDPFTVQRSYFRKPKSYFADVFDKSRMTEFLHGNDEKKLFSQAERSNLVSYILDSTVFENDDVENDNGDETSIRGINKFISLGVFNSAYPLHDGHLLENDSDKAVNIRQKLCKEWASFSNIFKYQPLEAIKDYFGVKVAFYFAWIGFYTSYLVPASLIGFLCFFFGGISNIWFEPVEEICSPANASLYFMCPLCDKLCSYYYLKDFSCTYAKVTHLFDNDASAVFSVFMSIWSVFFLEYWKRRQFVLSYNWHTMDFYEEETIRPQYAAAFNKLKKNQITGKYEPYASKKQSFLKMTGTATVVIFFVLLVIAALIGVIVYRATIFGLLLTHGEGTVKENSKMIVTITAAIINLLVINILKVVYNRLARIMTDWENPRTKTDYEKSFTIKMFWFQFFNTYSSVFYIAFFKGEIFTGWPGQYRRIGKDRYRVEGCSVQGCFLELCVQLVILMGGQQLLGNFVEILLPFLKKVYSKWKHEIYDSRKVPIWEADYQLSPQEELSLFWEYQEVVIQYGFVSMFVAAFPLAPIIALATNLVEIRIDAINMVKLFRRPVASKSEGIGVWQDILTTLTALGVLVNGFVLSITSEFIPRMFYQYQVSPDQSLDGYINWSLSYFKISDFHPEERPENPLQFVNERHEYCRFPGFHHDKPPYSFNDIHWELMTFRLFFAFAFQWFVSASGRILAWIIPDKPRKLNLKIKRQEYLAREALRKHKIKTGKRRPDRECSCSEASGDEDEDEGSSIRKRPRSKTNDSKRSKSSGHSKSSSKKIKHRTSCKKFRKQQNLNSKKPTTDEKNKENSPVEKKDVAIQLDMSNNNVTYVPFPSADYLNQML